MKYGEDITFREFLKKLELIEGIIIKWLDRKLGMSHCLRQETQYYSE